MRKNTYANIDNSPCSESLQKGWTKSSKIIEVGNYEIH